MSGFTYILLFMALVSPVLSAFLLRYLRTRLTAVPFYSIGAVLFALAAGAVIWLAQSQIERVQVGSLTVAQPQGVDLDLPSGPPPATRAVRPTLTALPTATPTAAPATATPTARPATATPRPRPSATPAATPTTIPTITLAPAPTDAPTQQSYVVQDGDTLRSIAEDFGVTVQDLLDTNSMSASAADSIQPGDTLIIP